VSGNICIHARPIEALKEALLHFVDPIMTGEKLAVSLGEGLRN
jgi:hypothetical protein